MTYTDDKTAQLHFWAIGDLHYRAIPAWRDIHTRRLAPMYDDLHALWQAEEERPAFCASPGDLVETCAQENYRVARETIKAQLGNMPFYPGVGNHEYHGPDGEDPSHMADTYTNCWDKPLRYTWEVDDFICIMLDYPNPRKLVDSQFVYIFPETLAFLDESLEQHASQCAIIFLHCPLRNTVLDRDPAQHRDYHSLEHFFAPENSQDVRDILTRHRNACLFLSGHTHSGWQAPNLVCTEQLGGHPVTFVNLMSPWYTGTHRGARLSADRQNAYYVADDPDVSPTFSIRLYHQHASIRVRDHLSKQWLKEWQVPIVAD
jgi:hypothetical protein